MSESQSTTVKVKNATKKIQWRPLLVQGGLTVLTGLIAGISHAAGASLFTAMSPSDSFATNNNVVPLKKTQVL